MNIFLVYGKSLKLKNEIQSILEKLGHEVIDLAEKSNKGKTIIEKIESYSNIDKAVVLMTGDDLVKPYKGRKTIKCARQNVVFELGYFVAKLKRENVILIIDNSDIIKLLTDYQVGYIKYGKNIEKKLIDELRS